MSTINDPAWPAPTSTADCIALLHFSGVEGIKPAMEYLEANDPAHARTLAKIHRLLNEAGYLLEDLLGQPDDAFGAGGGGGKGGGGGSGGGGGG